jgi:RNA polymerase sigma-70 factor, ECF subfamily
MEKEKTDNELMMEFKGCSEKAFECIYHRYFSILYRYIHYSFLNDHDLSQDAVQTAMIHIWESKFIYDPGKNFTSWIFTIAKNISIDILRSNNRGLKRFLRFKNSNDFDDYLPIVSNDNLAMEIENKDRKTFFTGAIRELGPKYREILTLRYIEGLNFNEIAEKTGRKKNTLISLANRGLKLFSNNKNLKELE